jgi:multiple sugar transport system substrate-binding protein
MKKQIASLLLIFLLVISSTAGYAKVTLDYAIVGFASVLPTHAQLIDAFNASQSEIEVVMRNYAGDSENVMLETLAIELASGSGPDVLFFNDKALPAFANKGAFVDITPYVERDMKRDMDDFFPGSVSAYRMGEALYGLPVVLHVLNVYYNNDLLSNAGLKYTSKWTIDDFTNIARKTTLKNSDGDIVQWGLHGFNWWPAFLPFLWMYGGDYFTPSQPNKETFVPKADSPESLKALKWLEGTVADKLHGGAFFTGTAALRVSNSSEAGYITFGDNWDYAHMPTGPLGTKISRLSSTGWVMCSGSKNKEAAWQLMRFLLSKENVYNFATASNGLGSRRWAVSKMVSENKTKQNKMTLLEILDYSRPHPSCAVDVTALELAIRTWYSGLYAGNIDHLTMANSLQGALKALLP